MYNQILSASNSEFKKALEVNTCRSTAPLTMSSSYDQFNFHRKIYSYVSKYREKKIPFLKILTFSNSVIFLDCLQLEFNVCVCVFLQILTKKFIFVSRIPTTSVFLSLYKFERADDSPLPIFRAYFQRFL